MPESSSEIKTEHLSGCPLCGHAQSRIIHQDLQDHLFGATGRWSFARCNQCELVFLNPRPVPADIHKAYTELYSTRKKVTGRPAETFSSSIKRYLRQGYYGFKHGYVAGTTTAQRWMGALVSLMPMASGRFSEHIMGIPQQSGGRLLDVGCGVGGFLVEMSALGWQVEGVDMDPMVVESCQRLGLNARVGTLESLRYPDETFDVITSRHVIEHVYDPVAFLAEIRRILKTGGTAYLRTPNIDSFGYRSFRQFWLGLEAPRHLLLYSPSTLARVAQSAGFRSAEVSTSARITRVNSLVGRELRDHNRSAYRSKPTLASRLGAHVDGLRARFQLFLGNEVGDEILLIAKK